MKDERKKRTGEILRPLKEALGQRNAGLFGSSSSFIVHHSSFAFRGVGR
jgi:hypothetical protein